LALNRSIVQNPIRTATSVKIEGAECTVLVCRPDALAGGLNVENFMFLTFRSVLSDKKRGCCK
jgi:hypothetical protein